MLGEFARDILGQTPQTSEPARQAVESNGISPIDSYRACCFVARFYCYLHRSSRQNSQRISAMPVDNKPDNKPDNRLLLDSNLRVSGKEEDTFKYQLNKRYKQ